MPSHRLQHTVALLTLFYSATLWGLFWYPFRLLDEMGVDGLTATCIAFLLPTLVVGWWYAKDLWQARAHWFWLVILGLTSGWSNVGYVLGALEGEVMRVLLLFYLSPLWTVLFAWFLLRERLNAIGWLVVALSLGGALVMLWQPDGRLPANQAEWFGLSAGVTFALSIVAGRYLSTNVSNGAKTLTVWLGVTILTGVGLFFVPFQGGLQVFTPNAIWILLGLAVALGSVTYAVQYGITLVPASRSNVIFLFELIIAAIAAFWLTQERMDWQEWVGAAMIITSSLFSGKMHAMETTET
ncbi:DMT family transporter [Thiothrix litoralis]|jgi:drug/metabolite transporter (DMT)-like permease|uniref:DMT family transporter n=1 Tax=Thiothrix litoralis TaxID=2891210 RepID=A0ABX7WTK7_9GAMM|nr:DMT family transporter [Thiothrix litoralis]QTR46611.1 DMT family transporter [Thiothrix litoralis]